MMEAVEAEEKGAASAHSKPVSFFRRSAGSEKNSRPGSVKFAPTRVQEVKKRHPDSTRRMRRREQFDSASQVL
jgi:hypothetical protein